MANQFPNALNNYSGAETDSAAGHAQAHNAVETKLGIDSSVVTTSIDYLLKNASSIDPGHHHTNSTLDSIASTKVTGVTFPSSGLIAGTTDTQTLLNKLISTGSSMAESLLTLTDITTNNVSTTKHGFAPKLPNDATKFLDGTGAYSAPASNTDGWSADTNTWTYSSVDGATGVITINADLTGIIQAGDRIKFTQTTVKYFIVTKTPTFGAGSTTLTFWGGTDYALVNAAITLPSYSHAKAPFGFNTDPGKWKIRVTDTTDRSQASPVAATWYNLGTTASQITLPIGIWNVTYNVNLQQDKAAVVQVSATLSTANNTESDSELTTSLNAGAAFQGGSVSKFKTLTVAAKAIYYLNTTTSASAVTTIYNRNSASGSAMVMEAVCAYI